MRASLTALALVSLVGCAGRTTWEGTFDDAGRPIFEEVTLRPGASGSVDMTLIAGGSHSGTYDITVSSADPAVATATAEPTSGEVDDDNPLDVVVTITAAMDAPSGESTSVSVEASNRGDDSLGVSNSVRVYIE